jgi:hypothetical protein
MEVTTMKKEYRLTVKEENGAEVFSAKFYTNANLEVDFVEIKEIKKEHSREVECPICDERFGITPEVCLPSHCINCNSEFTWKEEGDTFYIVHAERNATKI